MTSQNTKQMIQQGFDTVAADYDHPSLAFFPETAKRMVSHLNLKPHHHLLDVCTGTGVVALTAAEQIIQGKVVGIDLSSGMLQQARNKVAQKNLSNIEFVQMDLGHLEFPEASFDAATSSFGLFFLENMTQGLKHMVSRVKPGGQVAISSFTGDAFSPMADRFLNQYESFGYEVPGISWKRLATQSLIEEQFNAVNINNIHFHHEPLGYLMTSADMWWDVVWNAGWRGLLNQLSETEQYDFKARHMEEIAQIIGAEGVWFNTEVLIAVGVKD